MRLPALFEGLPPPGVAAEDTVAAGVGVVEAEADPAVVGVGKAGRANRAGTRRATITGGNTG